MPHRPMLKPALRRLWRDPASVQLGLDPRRAVVLSGLEHADVALLDMLDGTHDAAELAEVGAPGRVEDLLSVLDAAHALDDSSTVIAARSRPRLEPDLLALSLRHPEPGRAAAIVRARAATELELLGAGRVGAMIAMIADAAGIGTIRVSDPGPHRGADLAPGMPANLASGAASRGEVAARMLSRRHTRPRRTLARSVVVLAPAASVLPPEWLAQVRHRPHLPIVVRENVATIGPLVVPGTTPCLRCVELARADRDPGWPILTAQLVGQAAAIEACEITLATAAAALASMQLLSWLDDDRAPIAIRGGALELSLDDLRLRRQTIHPHPECGCGAIAGG